MSPRPQSAIKRDTTSIKIDPEVWKKAKIEAIRQDIQLSELVERAIEDWINLEASKRARKK